MAINFNLSGLDLGTTGSSKTKEASFIEKVSDTLRGSLRTAFSFANNIPTHVYMLTAFSVKDGETVGESRFLFQLNDKIVEPERLNTTGFKGHTFDVGHFRLNQLKNWATEDVTRLINLFNNHSAMLPQEIYSWIDVSKKNPQVNLNYRFDDVAEISIGERLNDWKSKIRTPQKNFYNMPGTESNPWFGLM